MGNTIIQTDVTSYVVLQSMLTWLTDSFIYVEPVIIAEDTDRLFIQLSVSKKVYI